MPSPEKTRSSTPASAGAERGRREKDYPKLPIGPVQQEETGQAQFVTFEFEHASFSRPWNRLVGANRFTDPAKQPFLVFSFSDLLATVEFEAAALSEMDVIWQLHLAGKLTTISAQTGTCSIVIRSAPPSEDLSERFPKFSGAGGGTRAAPSASMGDPGDGPGLVDEDDDVPY